MNRNILLTSLLISMPMAMAAQTTHFVETGGSSLGPTLPYYSPNVLNIQLGDIVTWTNVSGTHNVNADLFYFPTNPEGFSSGTPSNQPWTFSHTFTVAGVYNYMCNTEGHSATQTGRIIVLDASAVPDQPAERPFTLSPTTATDHLFVGTGGRAVDHFEILGLDGRQVAEHGGEQGPVAQIPVHYLPSGNYLLRIVEAHGQATTLRFSKH